MAARLTTYVVVAIVAATLIAGLIVGAQRDDSNGPVDVIVFNARVYTADGSGRVAEAVAIRGNQVLRVGSDREVARLRRPQTLMIDARGGSVLPGFNDADVRLIDGGLSLDDVNLAGSGTREEAAARIQAWADAHPARAWITGRGWREDAFGKGGPTRQQLDSATGMRPACLLSETGDAAWVNSAALRLAGLTRKSPAPPGGVIEKDPRTSVPSGVLRGTALEAVTRLIPPATPDERARALQAATAEAHAHGITSVQDTGATEADLPLYEEARRSGTLDLRVYSSLRIAPGATPASLAALQALAQRYPDDPVFKAGAVRLAIDAPLEPEIDADALNKLVRLLDAGGWQIRLEAFGARAVRMALDAYDHAAMSNPEPARGRRHRIEHVGRIDPEDLPKFRPLGLVAVVEPADEAWTAPALLSSRTRVALATGWPGVALDPLAAIDAAVNRGERDGMPVARAIDGFTAAPAYASFDEHRKGSIKAGMLADMVVLTGDLLSSPADRLPAIDVALTIFDGRIVYRRGAASTN